MSLHINRSTMSLSSLFIGVPQSKYAAIAIAVSLVVISLSMLVGYTDIPLTQRLLFAFLMILLALPSVLLSLFHMTCLVTGAGAANQRWWCSIYAWITTILIVLYCCIIVVAGITIMTNRSKVKEDFKQARMKKMTIQPGRTVKEGFTNIPANSNNLTNALGKVITPSIGSQRTIKQRFTDMNDASEHFQTSSQQVGTQLASMYNLPQAPSASQWNAMSPSQQSSYLASLNTAASAPKRPPQQGAAISAATYNSIPANIRPSQTAWAQMGSAARNTFLKNNGLA